MSILSKNLRCFQELLKSLDHLSGDDNRLKLEAVVSGIYDKWMERKLEYEIKLEAKSEQAPAMYMLAGNRLSTEGNHEGALMAYTMAIAHAIGGSNALRSAYNQRTITLMNMNRYDDCLAAINHMLELEKCSSAMKKELKTRKMRCLAMRSRRRAAQAQQAQGGQPDGGDGDDAVSKKKPWNDPNNFQNPDIPDTTSKVRLGYDERHGRYLEATEDFQPGKVYVCSR